MDWNNCFSGERFGDSSSPDAERTGYERDWDRLIFSSAFRRLQNKTQVFPLPDEVFVHNRLTHSLEVASVGRSLGKIVGSQIGQFIDVKENKISKTFYREHLKSVISSACLAHDLGNPAFGHSGEEAISSYFHGKAKDLEFRSFFSAAEWNDLLSFEGNANALRILTRAFRGRQPGGFRLTYSTLGAILKYPCDSTGSQGKNGPKHRSKYGFFQSDRTVFEAIASKLQMIRENESLIVFKRHPFVYLVEAADDICYNIIDFEDAHRLGIFPTDFVIQTLLNLVLLNSAEDHQKVKDTIQTLSEDANETISYLRAKSISYLVSRCASVFIENAAQILDGTFEGDLIGKIEEAKAQLELINKLSIKQIYNHPSVIKIELSGFRIMAGLVEDFVEAALIPKSERKKSHQKVISLIPAQYVFDEHVSPYEKVMCIFDFVSGMTDLYALKLYRNLRGIEIPTI